MAYSLYQIRQHRLGYQDSNGQRRQVIGSYLGYFDRSANNFRAAQEDLEPESGMPPDWQGAWDFAHVNLRSELQSFAVLKKPGARNTAMWGGRSARNPERWFNLRAYNTELDVSPVLNRAARRVQWSNLWPFGGSMALRPSRGFIRKVVQHDPGPQRVYEFTLRTSDSLTPDVVNNQLVLRSGPDVSLYSYPVNAWDGDGEHVDAALVDNGLIEVGGQYYTHLSLVVADTTGRPGPIRADPTVTISGTTDLEDSKMRSVASRADWNFGWNVLIDCGPLSGDTRRGIWRVKQAALTPATGTIDAVRMKVYRIPAAVSLQPGTMECYGIDTGLNWVAGTKVSGAASTNEVTHNSYRHPTAWPGGGGAVNDIDASTSGSIAFAAYTSGPDVLHTMTFTANGRTVITNMRDGTRTDDGFLMTPASGDPINAFFSFRSLEASSNNWTLEIDHTPPGGNPIHLRRAFGIV